MKKVLFFLLSLSQFFFVYAQTQADVNVDAQPLLNDPDFKNTDFPEKWKNESGVILCEKIIYYFDKNNSKILNKELTRKRIKLLDRSAVNRFSELYFLSTQDVKISVIKSDGTSNEIDLKEAVTVSEEISIPAIFRTNFKGKREYRKLAIPGLEVNDIIDYCYGIENARTISNQQYAFPELMISLNSLYPTVKRKIEFHVENSFNINFKNQNGAPDLKEQLGARSGFKVFYFEDLEREKYEEEKWVYIYRNTPTIKFQVVYVKDPKKSTYYLGEKGVLKKNVSELEILEKFHGKVFEKNTFISTFESRFNSWLNIFKIDRGLKTISNSEIVKQAYYYYRHFRFFNNEGYTLAKEFDQDDYFLFLQTLTSILRSHKIDYKLVVAAPSDITGLNDVVLKEELMCFIKVMADEKEFYLCPPFLSSCFNEIPYNYQGAECYEMNLHTDIKKSGILKTTLPKHLAENNSISYLLKLSIDTNDITQVNMNRTVQATGYHKDQFTYIVNYYESVQKEFMQYNSVLYGTTSFFAEEKNHNEKTREKLKKELSEEYDLLSYKNYVITDDGRGNIKGAVEKDNYGTNYLKFTDDFVLKGLTKKVGQNYFFEVGKLIGKQLAIPENELIRKSHIYYTPRSYNYELIIKIPENYLIEGLNNLSFNVNNSTGHFNSSFLINGDELIIKVSKAYYNSNEDKVDWGKIIEFLSASNKFYQTKILLKKKE